MFRFRTRAFSLIAVGLVACAGLVLWYRATLVPKPHVAYGVTFSTLYAKELGLDWKQAYLATLDDLGVRKLRLPVYWDAVEAKKGAYDWSEVDWMLEEAAKRDADVILAVGRKTPRWPECHVPGWAASLEKDAQDAQTLRFLAAEIEHFKRAPAVKTWQVENEPLFRFGKCPEPDRELLKREVSLVRESDPRPVMLTDSGELSTWIRTGTLSDVLGISMYRLVWNNELGELYWPVSPLYYADRMSLLKPVVKKIIVSELQAEPWFRKPVEETPISEQLEQMNPERLKQNVRFASSSSVSEVYLWGVEWWYWLARHEHPELWETSKAFFK